MSDEQVLMSWWLLTAANGTEFLLKFQWPWWMAIPALIAAFYVAARRVSCT